MPAHDVRVTNKVHVTRGYEPSTPYCDYHEVDDIAGLAALPGAWTPTHGRGRNPRRKHMKRRDIFIFVAKPGHGDKPGSTSANGSAHSTDTPGTSGDRCSRR